MQQFGQGIGSVQPIIDYAYANLNNPNGIQEVNNATQQLKTYFARGDLQ